MSTQDNILLKKNGNGIENGNGEHESVFIPEQNPETTENQ